MYGICIATNPIFFIVLFIDQRFATFNPLTPRRTQVSPFTEISILFYFKKVSSKKLPMSVAPMSR